MSAITEFCIVAQSRHGTPHRGLHGVDDETFLTNLLRVCNVDIRTDLLEEQRSCSAILFDLTEDFKQLIAAKNIEVATLFEIKKTEFTGFSPIWVCLRLSFTCHYI